MVLHIPITDVSLEKRLYKMYTQMKQEDRSKTWNDLIRDIIDKMKTQN